MRGCVEGGERPHRGAQACHPRCHPCAPSTPQARGAGEPAPPAPERVTPSPPSPSHPVPCTPLPLTHERHHVEQRPYEHQRQEELLPRAEGAHPRRLKDGLHAADVSKDAAIAPHVLRGVTWRREDDVDGLQAGRVHRGC